VQKIGENIQLGTITIVEGPVVGGYIHNQKAGAIVALSAGTPELAKDVAMHGSAMKPAFVTGADVPADARAKAEELFKEEVAASGKPADIQAKMLEGKLNTYFKEQTLVDQMFIKDPSLTIDAYLKKNGAALVAYKPLSLI
jgi:elongation factor Ts